MILKRITNYFLEISTLSCEIQETYKNNQHFVTSLSKNKKTDKVDRAYIEYKINVNFFLSFLLGI